MNDSAAPAERPTLDDAWRTLLLHEFHDILPGSSIGPVYDDARVALIALAERLDSFIAQAERDLTASDAEPADTSGGWLLHNPSPCATPGGSAIALLPLSHDAPLPALSANDRALPAQEALDSAGERFALVATPPVAGRGWLRLSKSSGAHATRNEARTLSTSALSATLTAEGGAILESALYYMRLDAQGCIVSLRDKRALAGRELIAAGRVGNHFIAFDDRPLEFDAWDIDAT